MGGKVKEIRTSLLPLSDILENAPYILEVGNGSREGYTTTYAMRCRSCQSQNCPQTRIPKLSRLES
jgi:hypothetical protein